MLDHPADTDGRRIHVDAGAFVVEWVVAGTEADFEPALREQVDGCELTCEHRRMPEIACQHQ